MGTIQSMTSTLANKISRQLSELPTCLGSPQQNRDYLALVGRKVSQRTEPERHRSKGLDRDLHPRLPARGLGVRDQLGVMEITGHIKCGLPRCGKVHDRITEVIHGHDQPRFTKRYNIGLIQQ